MEKDEVIKPADDHDDQMIHLPPGFRFHPSDEELVVHYLSKKKSNQPIPAAIFTEVELYKFNPWDLPMKASSYAEDEWYFFTPRERKYPNGMRPNRMTTSGYWKATGTDKPVISSCGSNVIGVKKALVFYLGRPPKGNKTDWNMQEYRLPEATSTNPMKQKTSSRLDDWVLCRVWQKTGTPGKLSEYRNGRSREPAQVHTRLDEQWSKKLREQTAPMEVMFRDCPTLPFLMDFQNPCLIKDADVSSMRLEGKEISTDTRCTYDTNEVSNINFEGIKATTSVCEDNFNVDYHGMLDITTTTLVPNTSTRMDGKSKDISFKNINKKPAVHKELEKDSERTVVVPLYSGSKTTNGAASWSTRQSDEDDSIWPLDQLLMSPDLCGWSWALP